MTTYTDPVTGADYKRFRRALKLTPEALAAVARVPAKALARIEACKGDVPLTKASDRLLAMLLTIEEAHATWTKHNAPMFR